MDRQTTGAAHEYMECSCHEKGLYKSLVPHLYTQNPHTHTQTDTLTHTYTQTHTHTYIYTHKYPLIHTQYTQTQTYIHNTHKYADIHTHTHSTTHYRHVYVKVYICRPISRFSSLAEP